MAEKQSYRMDELAVRWCCHERTVRRAIETGELAAFRVGRMFRVLASEVKRYETGKRSDTVPPEQEAFDFGPRS